MYPATPVIAKLRDMDFPQQGVEKYAWSE